MLTRLATAVYAALAYLAFLLAVAWAVAFLAGAVVSHPVDGAARVSWLPAAAIDLSLLGLFAVQHSGMARLRVKRALSRLVPAALERTTYVLLASGILMAVFALWQPIGGTVWNVAQPVARASLLGLYAAGWMIVVSSTFMIDHLELVGLRQAGAAVSRRPARAVAFRESWLYAWVRHPMMLGLLVVFWASPRMTAGHLLFTLASSGYILVGVWFEERDLRATLGGAYVDYAERVPMLVPRRRPQRRAA